MFFSKIKKKKKITQSAKWHFCKLTAATSRLLTEDLIRNDWNVEDLNDKTQTNWNEKLWNLEDEFCILTFFKI